jgi:hypothetical protein
MDAKTVTLTPLRLVLAGAAEGRGTDRRPKLDYA